VSVSKFTSSTGLNDFNLNIQATNSTVIFDAEKAAGSYSIVSAAIDNSIDIYAYASDGNLAGVTSGKAFTASRNFNKMVIIGGTIGDVLSFSFKTTYATAQETAEITAGPFINSVSPTSLPNVNSTTTVGGGNFASGITATFIGSDAQSYPAKSVVVGSPQSIIVTRPDVFPTSANPYTLKLSNPGVTDPTGSAANILSNGLTAGSAPVWTTASGTIATFTKNIPFSTTVVATDPDGGSIVYSITPGYSLPSGLSLGSSTGIISGTPTVSTGVTFFLRATDSGGNYVDRSFTLADSGPTWTTSGSFSMYQSLANSYQLVASDDSGIAPTFSLVSGSLPAGFSLSSAGVISGTTSSALGNYSIVVAATDNNGVVTNQSLTLVLTSFYSSYIPVSFTAVTIAANNNSTFTAPSTGSYEFEITGSCGGVSNGEDLATYAGKGRKMVVRYNLLSGQTVQAVAGGGAFINTSGNTANGGGQGGGGSFVWIPASSNLLIGAAGGGGAGSINNGGSSPYWYGIDGQPVGSTSGTNSRSGVGAGSGGGDGSSSGGQFPSHGWNTMIGSGNFNSQSGWYGTGTKLGGGGGPGDGSHGGGGGGGYSGGGGGTYGTNTGTGNSDGRNGGGGGGTYVNSNARYSQDLGTNGTNEGYVIIRAAGA
jgi:hypothetical protein